MTRYSQYQIESEAASWVAQMDAGWSASQEQELQAWLAADVRRHGALLHAQAAWMSVDRAKAPGVNLPRIGRPVSRRSVFVSASGAIAASLVGGLLWLEPGRSYSTETGEIRRVSLADGSVASINTGSRIKIRLTRQRREAEVAQGEAWFQIAKDPHRPFVVEAGRARVQAIGTAFSVRRFDGRAEVLVTEGVVEAWADGAEGHRVRLGAGERAFVADDAAIWLGGRDPAAIDRALAWRSGVINLVGVPLVDAVSEFNRYNRRQIVLANPAIGREQLDGVFRLDDPDGFCAAVRDSLGADVEEHGDVIRLSGPAATKT